jgi:hypothetical protein
MTLLADASVKIDIHFNLDTRDKNRLNFGNVHARVVVVRVPSLAFCITRYIMRQIHG